MEASPEIAEEINEALRRNQEEKLTIEQIELNQSMGIPPSSKGARSFFDISSPETSEGLRIVGFQTKGSLSRISTVASSPVDTLRIDPVADLKYLNVDDFSDIAPLLYQKSGENATELARILRDEGFTEASIGVNFCKICEGPIKLIHKT